MEQETIERVYTATVERSPEFVYLHINGTKYIVKRNILKAIAKALQESV